MRRWKDPIVWARGLLAAFIGGGAGAVASGAVACVKTPAAYNLDEGLSNLLTMMVGTFVVTGAINAAAYLQRSPLPEVEEVENGGAQRQLTRENIGLHQPPPKE